MNKKIFIKPEGIIINPETGRPVPHAGTWVILNSFWKRRLKDKDCIKLNTVDTAKPVKQEEKQKERVKKDD